MNTWLKWVLGLLLYGAVISGFALLGAAFGNLLGEKMFGNFEPLWETMLGLFCGGICGFVLGGVGFRKWVIGTE